MTVSLRRSGTDASGEDFQTETLPAAPETRVEIALCALEIRRALLAVNLALVTVAVHEPDVPIYHPTEPLRSRPTYSLKTHSGRDRNALAKGKKFGRPRADVDAASVAALRHEGLSWSQVCRTLNVSKGRPSDRLHALPKSTAELKGVAQRHGPKTQNPVSRTPFPANFQPGGRRGSLTVWRCHDSYPKLLDLLMTSSQSTRSLVSVN